LENTQKLETKVWEEIVPKPFETVKVSYVVCLNTMGQDREFTEQEKLFALRTARTFRDYWEEIEKKNLEADILKRIDSM